ncbi:MAG: hypothetical protein IKP32_08835 [Clostridia bacterium]|nr:hypothetical protein [Clostridia bacterium]
MKRIFCALMAGILAWGACIAVFAEGRKAQEEEPAVLQCLQEAMEKVRTFVFGGSEDTPPEKWLKQWKKSRAYAAQASLYVISDEPITDLNAYFQSIDMDAYITALSSDEALEEILSQLYLDMPLEEFRERIFFYRPPDTQLIEIYMVSLHSAREAVTLLNKAIPVCTAFIKNRMNWPEPIVMSVPAMP